MSELTFRMAVQADLEAIVDMLADDKLGATREDNRRPLPECYTKAFEQLEAQPGSGIIVADLTGEVVGCLQITIIPGVARMGLTRAQIEAVRVASTHRGKKIGHRLFDHAITYAREMGCRMIQLTTDMQRPEAKRFYEALGFEATHYGMKLSL